MSTSHDGDNHDCASHVGASHDGDSMQGHRSNMMKFASLRCIPSLHITIRVRARVRVKVLVLQHGLHHMSQGAAR